jgi:outer membrane immunogenic protein
MKNIACITLAVLAATPAFAADLYSAKDAPQTPYASATPWSGFYVGVSGGWGQNVGSLDSTLVLSAPPSTDTIGVPVKGPNPTGFLAGVQTGYFWQSGNFVFGPELSFTGSNISGDATSNPTTISLNGVPESPGITGITTTSHQQLDWIAALTGTVGVQFGTIMPYVKGGFAAGQIQESVALGEAGVNLISLSRKGVDEGWTAGGGIAYKVAPSWILALEYDYYDFGDHAMSKSVDFGGGETLNGATTKVPETFEVVKASFNYQFGSVYAPLK